ncbi:IS21 family transposase [bacterium]|nr:IS21 family transposase [bacterium]
MFHYQEVIIRLRRNEGRRLIQAALRMGPRKLDEIRQLATRLGWLDPNTPLPSDETIMEAVKASRVTQASQASIVEPYRELVLGWIKEKIEAQTIWSHLTRAHGFTGSYSSVRRFVRKLSATLPDPVVRLHFPAGQVAQVDFGSGPILPDPVTGRPRKTHVFVMTLAYSRHQYAEIVWDQSAITWLRCHRNAFEFWGGVPAKVMPDNLKAAVVRACYYDALIQRSYGEFAREYGFQISPCVARTPEHKGLVESGVRYVKRSFLNSPRTFTSIGHANQQLLEWVLGEAGNRSHGTTHQVPLKVFAEEEKPILKPLPAERVELAVWSTAKVHPDCHVVFQKSYYSVPYRLVGEQLDLRAGDCSLMLFQNLNLVACHPRATRPGQWRTTTDHLPEEKMAYLKQTPDWCKKQAGQIGESCGQFMAELLGDKVLDRLRSAQGLLRLARKYGPRRLDKACHRALAYDNIRYYAVKKILELGLDQLPLEECESGQLELPFAATSPRFARPMSDLFSHSLN